MSSSFSIGGVAKGGLAGGFVGGLINIGLYFVGSAVGADYVMNPDGPVDVVPFFQPLVSTLIASVGAVVVMAILVKLLPSKAWTVFLVLAGLVFLVALPGPPSMFADTTTIVMLELMHVPAAAGILLGMHKLGRG